MSIDEKEQFCSNIEAYKLNMFRLAKTIVRNDVDVEDAVCEAICKAYTNRHALRNVNSFKPWIMRIVANESYNITNRRKRTVYYEEIALKEEVLEENTAELWSVVQNLEDEFRAVTVLFYYEDMSIKDISKTLDIPQGTVKSRLSRARAKLKEQLYEGSNES